jgi:chromosome partitioning protein
MFDKLFEEMHDAVWETCYEEVLRTSHLDKIDQIMANADAVKADLEEAKAKAGEGM